MGFAKATYDAGDGVVRCQYNGLLTSQEVADFALELDAAVKAARRQHPRVLFLSDASDGVVQSAATVEALRIAAKSAMRPEDRSAIIVNSVLMRMQVNRSLDQAFEQAFLSRLEAEQWLFTDRH